MHAGDLSAQFAEACKQVKDALRAADMATSNIVRLNSCTTNVDRFMAQADGMVAHFAKDRCGPSCTLLGVTRLYHPDIFVELEAAASA